MESNGTATFSPCERYRYDLTRIWQPELPLAAWIMLNPSTADADKLDPTIRRCCGFTRDWGYGGLVVLNLYAWRETDSSRLFATPDPVGKETDSWILLWLRDKRIKQVVCAWGAHAEFERVDRLRELLRTARRRVPVSCLGLTKAGQPKHPLYLRKDTDRLTWQ